MPGLCMRSTLAAALAVSVVAAAPYAGAGTTSGLHGVVRRGPVTPVCLVGTPCDRPAAHVRLTFRRNGVAKAAVTDGAGRYRIVLAPGTYAVRISPAQFRFTPRTATVTRGRMAVRNFWIDTGIR
jgi:hypothetical protein